MPTGAPSTIPFPLSSFPGANPQESAGRLINVYSEPLGDPQQSNYGAPRDGVVWRRLPGLTQFALTTQSGYRGGMLATTLDFEVFAGEALTVDGSGNVILLGSFPGTSPVSIARNLNQSSPDVVAVDPVTGAYVLNSLIQDAMVTATIGGSSFVNADTVSLIFTNAGVTGLPITKTFTLGAAETAITIATGLKTLINADATLSAANISATSIGAIITISQIGLIGNSTVITNSKTGSGNETVAYSPASGQLAGGTGIAGAFTGVPTFYNGQTNLPQPNSVSFQDGYFFFTTAAGFVYASGINSLSMNALTFVHIQAKADVTLLRGIAFQGYMFFFTTGSCEVWNDAANAAPAFPYGRSAILAYGLLQGSAIAGYETGFDDLLWVAQDFGVYRLTQGSMAPTKVSPPDLDRLIEAQYKAGNTLQAGAYIFAGKKVWALTSPGWTWQFHLNSMKWFERTSLAANGSQGQWRGVGGHPAFGKWLMGDQQSGAVLFIDDTNNSDIIVQNPATWVTLPAHMLLRIESGIVDNFPARTRVARADFHFVRGVGSPVGSLVMQVVGAAAGTGGVVRLAVNSTLGANTGDQVTVAGVVGTTEANGLYMIEVIDGQHIELAGTVFVDAYTGGGTVTDYAIQENLTDPTIAISWSDDGGLNWRPPVLRNIGPLDVSKTGRVTVKNSGLTGVMGRRWRIDISAPVYTAFLKATQSSDPTITN